MPVTAIATDSRVKAHDPGPGHPEQPARYGAVMNRLESSGLLHSLLPIKVRPATDDELALAHSRSYLDLVAREVASGRSQLSTGDTDIGPHSDEISRLASGCVLSAVDAVFSGQATNAFCPVRPPGHHANASRGMGFCFFNHIAVAARYAQSKYGAERVVIVDWDVHHGNGTQDIFYEDSSVLFFSTHQSPWYPGTGAANERGEGKGQDLTLNCPFPAGAGGREIWGAFREIFIPAVEAFRPDLLLISAGFDSRADDPLGRFQLRDDDFRQLTELMTDTATRHCHNRLVSVLEGGYSLEGLACGTEAHVKGLLGEK
jgi:acetoin utilization deacetylase AcuC-like enzyme